jgi:hypothetical protein
VRVALAGEALSVLHADVERLEAALVDVARDRERRRRRVEADAAQAVDVGEERLRQIDRCRGQRAALRHARDEIGGLGVEDLLEDRAGARGRAAVEALCRPAPDRRLRRVVGERVGASPVLSREPLVRPAWIVLRERVVADGGPRRVPVLPRLLELLHQQRAAGVALEHALGRSRRCSGSAGTTRAPGRRCPSTSSCCASARPSRSRRSPRARCCAASRRGCHGRPRARRSAGSGPATRGATTPSRPAAPPARVR